MPAYGASRNWTGIHSGWGHARPARIAIAARSNLVLETGHSSPAEALLLIREARRQGVQSILVTHANSPLVGSLLLGLYDDDGLLNHVGFTSTLPAKEKPARSPERPSSISAR